jgi:hypothetical protein
LFLFRFQVLTTVNLDDEMLRDATEIAKQGPMGC